MSESKQTNDKPCHEVVRLLFVESSPYDLRLNEELVHGATHQMDLWRAHEWTAAVKYLQVHPFDAMLVDLTQPGLITMAQVKALAQAHPNLPVLALVKNGSDRADAHEAGCRDCLVKSLLTYNTLDHVVRKHAVPADVV